MTGNFSGAKELALILSLVIAALLVPATWKWAMKNDKWGKPNGLPTAFFALFTGFGLLFAGLGTLISSYASWRYDVKACRWFNAHHAEMSQLYWNAKKALDDLQLSEKRHIGVVAKDLGPGKAYYHGELDILGGFLRLRRTS